MVPTRRFGRTGLPMPVLSLGGMRYQQSWQDLAADQLSEGSQRKLTATVARAQQAGLHHVETARHYGSSELQLGKAFRALGGSRERILQTKVPPRADPAVFEAELERSFSLLGCQRLDLLSVHGINLAEHLEQTLRAGGCLAVLRRWQEEGRIGHVGFSTHAPTPLIVAAIESNAFDYLNLHWYFIRQDNDLALDAARRHDMGVFLISPTDKGGHLHSPSARLLELTAPLHPIVFNDLFCLADPRVHTISVGAACPSDLDLHLEAVARLEQADTLIQPVLQRLRQAQEERLGRPWLESWQQGLPAWQDTPGQLNLPVLLWLHNLLEAWDLESFVEARYGLLGNGSHWFPGANANGLGASVGEDRLRQALVASPWREEVIAILHRLKDRFGERCSRRLSSD